MRALIRRVPLILAFLVTALCIWIAGPYFAFADFHPLDPPTARIIFILLIVVVWLGWSALKRLRNLKSTTAFFAGMVQQARQARAPEPPSAEAAQLRERFEEAVAVLTKRRGQSLYDLPWYMFIGAPGSGKTTALVHSGLTFPLEQRSGKGALRGVGGTRNCDWWFTDEAVFIDTAGRYTTQDSDAATDSAAWTEFLALLLKYRKRRPLNGVILTISAEDLITQRQQAREAHIDAVHRRFAELDRQLGIPLPVYVLVTKCDLVAGFVEYFDELAQSARTQVWGVTFPIERSRAGDAASQFPPEFDALVRRLNERVFTRLQGEHDLRRRVKVFGFPQQVAGLRDPIAQFLDDVFAVSRFDHRPLLRGVYLTSGTQEGTPIDRLLVAMGRDFAVRQETVAHAGRGKAYFIERPLKDVLLPESGLAGVNRQLEMRGAGIEAARYAAVALVTVLGIAALAVSYGRNGRYLAQVQSAVQAFRQAPPASPSSSSDAVLELDAVAAVSDVANQYRDDTPWSMRWGLYQGNVVGNAARDAYARQLDGTLLPRLTERVHARLTDHAAEPEKLYEYLKAYLELGEPQHLDRAHLAFLADLEWKTAYASEPEKAAALSKHFHRLLDQGRLRPMPLDPVLVAQARSTIQRASIPRLIYSRLKLNYADDSAHALRLDVAAGAGSDRLLRRRSGAKLSDPMPALYTAAVFNDVTGKGMGDVIKQFSADYWVWGTTSLSIKDSAQIANDVTAVYEDEYITAWDVLLNDIELASFRDPADALAILGGPTSPLRALLQTVDANTTIVKAPDQSSGAIEKAQDVLGRLLERGKAAAGLPTAAPGSRITAHFAPIHQLLAGGPGAAPIDRSLGLIVQIGKQLLTVGAGAGQTSSLGAVEDPQLGAQVRSLQLEASTLPPAVRAIIGQVASRTSGVVISGATNELESRYRQDVLRECIAVVQGRYPFTPASTTDVALEDFARLFASDGVFDAFFKTNLQKLVDTSRSPWTWRPGSVGSSPALIRPFEAAARVREIFFGSSGRKPELHFSVTVSDVDAAATGFAIEIDGQRFENRHDPERPRPAVWPGPTPGVAAATFEDRSGGRPYRDYPGTWAWFRLVSFGQPQAESDVRSALRFTLGGHSARVRIEASTIHNPFVSSEWQHFRCAY